MAVCMLQSIEEEVEAPPIFIGGEGDGSWGMVM